MEPKERPINPNPQTGACFLSQFLFWWTNGLFRLGWQRHLEEVDIYDVLPEDSSVKLSNDLGREWEKELYKWKTGGFPSLFKALLRCYEAKIIGTGILFFIVEGCRIAQAIFLGLIVAYFEPRSTVTTKDAYIYAMAWSLVYVVVTIMDNLGFHKSFYYGMKMRVATTSMIYRKILRLNEHSLQESSGGTIVNLLSTDAHRFDQSCLAINYIWIGPLEAVVVSVLLWKYCQLGPACLIGLVIICLLAPLQFLMGRFLSRLRLQMSHLTDRRVRVMSEVIAGIKTIKINCFEKAFSNLVNTIRRSEWVFLRSITHCRGLNCAVYFSSGKIIMFSTFATYILLGNYTSASTLFMTLALFEILRGSVSLLLPWGIQYFMEAMDAVNRIQAFLLLDERNMIESNTQATMVNRSKLPDGVVIKFENFVASWGKKESPTILNGIDFTVPKGLLYMITGSMGSGKSSLLLAALGEIQKKEGSVQTSGCIGYTPQHPWIYSGTIRENILFGSPMDRRKYHNVMGACCLIPDIDSLPAGDLSVVGEKGILLTNCQKAKISLARAVYHNTATYLIDDIFCMMDEKTAITIFTRCFCGILSSRTIVLVTHQINFLKAADQIIILKQGKVAHLDTYDNLKNIGVNFDELLKDFGDNENESSLIENVKRKDRGLAQTMRQKIGTDQNYSSEESIDQTWLEFENSSESDQLMEEESSTGEVGWDVYWQYFRVGGGLCSLLTFMMFSLFAQVLYVFSDWWLYNWSQQLNLQLFNNISAENDELESSNLVATGVNFDIYIGLFLGFLLFSFLKSSLLSIIAINVGKKLHRKVFRAIMRAPLSFFEKNSIGKILSRFSRDIGYIDDPLPAGLADCVQFLGLVVSAVVVAAVANYWLLLVITPLLVIFVCARSYFIKTAREIKRLEVAAKLPVYCHLSNTLDGMWTIRAFMAEERFLRYFDICQDRHTAATYMYLAVNRWFALRMDALSIIFVSLIAFVSVAIMDTKFTTPITDAGLVGMALVYALNLMGLFQYSIRQSAEVEGMMAGLERVLKFTDTQPEGELITSNRPSALWPQYGIVTLEGVSLINLKEGTKILKNIWCCVRAEEKVGILGEPEECKEAIVSILLRLVEPHGVVRIDGIDVSDIGLRDLRERITHVPQDPMLFGGSLRRNLDPFTRFPDAQLWKALEGVHLKDKVDQLPGKLYADMSEFGNCFNIGERQLLCLSRALMKSSKIILFEESSSVVVKRTGSILHHVLSSRFSHCTLILFAQTVPTVIDTDRLMVLDEGKIKEFDPPHILLQNKKGHFYKKVHTLPPKDEEMLKRLAEDKYENRPYVAPPMSLGGNMGMPYAGRGGLKNFMPAFQTTRLNGVLSHFTGNRYSTNRF